MGVRSRITLFVAGLALCLAVFGAVPSPVADAAMKRDRAAVHTLLNQKADVNAPQADGATAIQWAAYQDDLEMAEMLIAAGANVKAANHDGAARKDEHALQGQAG